MTRRTFSPLGVAGTFAMPLVVLAAAAAPGTAVAAEHHSGSAKVVHTVLRVRGTDAGDKIALRLAAGQPGILQVDFGDDGSADRSFGRAGISAIDVNAGDGDDAVRVDESNGVFTDVIPTTISGGDGNDTIAGGSGNEILRGGDGDDVIDGNRGSDIGLLGDGDDTFVWDPGDGSDVVEGQDGLDAMVFNGAGVPEQVDLSANGSRLRFFRTQGNVTMDTAGVERVDFNALGGADTVTVNDLAGTDVTTVNVDLAGALGGVTGDGQPDRVIVNATDGDDALDVSGDSAEVKVSGLAATVRVLHTESANDRLEVNTFGGTDTVDSLGLAAGTIKLVVDGALVP
jgi:hemolysin type calcium-binding protein